MAGELIEVAPNLRVFVRGWLHGNVVLITRGEQAPALIDTGYCTGTAELIEAFDALWQDGLGILRPQVDGDAVFEQAAAALDTIEGLNPRVVVPGHGRPFRDVAAALAKARRRLARWRDDPHAHRQNLTRTFIAFWLLAHSGEALAAFEAALRDFFEEIIEETGVPFAPWRERVLAGLERHQLSSVRDGRVFPGQGIRSES